MRNLEIIEAHGTLYQVKRTFPESRINLNKGSVSDLKQFFYCDTMFRAKGHLWFCNEIKEISYEEIQE